MLERCKFVTMIRTATAIAFLVILGLSSSGCGSDDDDNDVTGDPGGGTLPNVSVIATDAIASENGNTGGFTILLNKAGTTDLDIAFELTGTADLGDDYTTTDSMTVTIAAGSTTASVVVTPRNDDDTEGTETVILTLVDSPEYTVTSVGATIEIREGEISGQTISVIADTPIAMEGGETGVFLISLSEAAETDLDVGFELTGTAIRGTDYYSTGGASMTVTIESGEKSTNVAIQAQSDDETEVVETVVLTLLDSPDYTITAGSAIVEIKEEEEISGQTISVVADTPIAVEGGGNGAFLISLSEAAEADMDIKFELTGTAIRGTDYYSAGGGSMTVTIEADSKTVSVGIGALSDEETEGIETVILTLLDSPDYTITTAEATMQIRDEGDNTELPLISVVATDAVAAETGDNYGTFTISLSKETATELIVDYAMEGTADLNTDYTITGAAAMAVVIPAESRTTEAIVIPRSDDAREGTETVVFKILESSQYIITTPTATIEIEEEEIVGPQVSVVAADDTLREGGETGEFTIQLDEAIDSALDITFRLSGSATLGPDYTADQTSLVSIPAGQTTASVVITPLDDAEDDETAEDIVLTIEGSAAYTIRTPEARMTIRPISVGGTTYDIADQRDFDDHNGMIFSPGDYIRFKRGQIFTGMFAPKGSGSPEQPIFIGTYGTGAPPIINAMGDHEAGILLKNVEQWEIEGIEITNTDGSLVHQGKLKGIYVCFDNPPEPVMSHIHIRNCHIHDVNGVTKDSDTDAAKLHGGIHVHTVGETSCRLHDVSITGNTVERTGGTGIATFSEHVKINSTRADQTWLWTELYVGHNYIDDTDRNNMIIRVSLNPLVEYNTLANSSQENHGHNLFNFNTVGFVAQYNEGYGNLGGGIDRGAYDADYNAIDTTYQYNYSHDNEWMIGIMNKFNEGVMVRYNISQNDRRGFIYYGFNVAFQSRDIKVYNNTYYVSSEYDTGKLVASNSVAKRTTFYNNIFYFDNGAAHGSRKDSWEDVVFSNNAYFGIDPWDGEDGAVTDNINLVDPGSGGKNIDMTDPDRLSGYRLRSDSDCINAGKTIPGVTQDFWGNPVPAGATDIGAHEYQP